jgi:hypothetical protein
MLATAYSFVRLIGFLAVLSGTAVGISVLLASFVSV